MIQQKIIKKMKIEIRNGEEMVQGRSGNLVRKRPHGLKEKDINYL